MNSLDPKKRLLQNKQLSNYLSDIVLQNQFKECLTVALTQMQMNLPSCADPSQAWNNSNKMEGAKIFIEILLNLASEAPEIKGLPSKALNPNPQPDFSKTTTKKDK